MQTSFVTRHIYWGIFFCALLLGSVNSLGQIIAKFNLSDSPGFGAVPYAGRQIVISQASPFQGNLIFLPLTDTNGITYYTNLLPTTLYNGYIAAPPGKINFQLYATTPNAGVIDVTNIIANGQVSTYPAGSVSWPIFVSDTRYAFSGTSSSNLFYPLLSNPYFYVSNSILLSASNGIVSQIPSTNGFLTAAAATNLVNQQGLNSTNFSLLIGSNDTNFTRSTALANTNLSYAIGLGNTNLSQLLAGTGSTNLNTTSNYLFTVLSTNPPNLSIATGVLNIAQIIVTTPGALSGFGDGLYTTNPLALTPSTNSFLSSNNVAALVPSFTNGLATIAYANSLTNGLAGNAASTNYVNTATNTVTTNLTASILAQGLASTNYTIGASNGIIAIIQATNSAIQSNISATNAAEITRVTAQIVATNTANLVITTNYANTKISSNAGAGTNNNLLLPNILESAASGYASTNINNVWSLNQPQFTHGIYDYDWAVNGGNPGNFGMIESNGVLAAISGQNLTGITAAQVGAAVNSVTNGLANTNWVISNFYPSSNPSNFSQTLTAATFKTLLLTNTGNSSPSPAFVIGYSNTLTHALKNLSIGISGNEFYLTDETGQILTMATNSDGITFLTAAGAGFSATGANGQVQLVGNNAATITFNGTNLLDASATPFITTAATNGFTSIVKSNAAQFVSQYGGGTNLALQGSLVMGTKTNWLYVTNALSLSTSGSMPSGTWYGTATALTNVFNPTFYVTFTGGNYFAFSNAVTLYTSADGATWTLVSGVNPVPVGRFGHLDYDDGTVYLGYFYSTNLIAQMTALTNNIGLSSGLMAFQSSNLWATLIQTTNTVSSYAVKNTNGFATNTFLLNPVITDGTATGSTSTMTNLLSLSFLNGAYSTTTFNVATNYNPTNFIPIAGQIRMCASNNHVYFVTSVSTNLIN
jgi:hypothetical protein